MLISVLWELSRVEIRARRIQLKLQGAGSANRRTCMCSSQGHPGNLPGSELSLAHKALHEFANEDLHQLLRVVSSGKGDFTHGTPAQH